MIPGIMGIAAGAMYAFFRRRRDRQPRLLHALVREAKLGLPWERLGPEGEGFVRWCFAASEERLAEGVGRLRTFLGH
jgi:aspartate/methionine/tyrosine aminotransferase